MGHQSSEMKDKYRGEPEVTMETRFNNNFQPFTLSDHHKNGPSKVGRNIYHNGIKYCCSSSIEIRCTYVFLNVISIIIHLVKLCGLYRCI